MSDDLHKRLIQAIADPGHFLPRGGDYTESIPSWSARAVMSILEEVHLPPTYEAKPGWWYDRKRGIAARGRTTIAGSPSFMARSDGPLIEVPGEVLYRLVERS